MDRANGQGKYITASQPRLEHREGESRIRSPLVLVPTWFVDSTASTESVDTATFLFLNTRVLARVAEARKDILSLLGCCKFVCISTTAT